MRILVTGSRDWDDEDAVLNEIYEASVFTPPGERLTVVHGACPTGADALVDKAAERLSNVDVERYPAEWDKYGKRAGFIRNLYMVNLGADLCLAFIKNNSKGASMTARLAEEAGIPVRRFEA